MSLRVRLTAVAAVVFTATLVGASLLILGIVEREARSAAADAVAEVLAQRAAFGVADTSEVVVQVGDEVGFGVFRREGELAFGSVFVRGVEVAVVELNLTTRTVNELRDPRSNDVIADRQLRSDLERLTLVFGEVADSDGDLLLVGAPAPESIAVSTAAAQRALWLIIPLVLLVALWVTWWLAGRALAPVEAITDRVRSIGSANLGERVPQPPGDDEIARLAATMNDMLARLESGDARLRRFSADVSHELRSPLSTIRAAAELAVAGPEEATSLAGDIVAESDRMNRIIGDLLLLASTEAGADRRHDVVDLAALCHDAAGPDVELRADGPVPVRGDADELARVVVNLVANAERHTADTVRVTVQRRGDVAELAVEDDGDGVPVDQRTAVFERFVRLDEARDRDSGGAGLGLALVAAIVAAHGGEVAVDTSPALGGARFVVTLPALH